ncbi:L-threonylcarbamoyladenylate synthase [Porphyromonas catoniae]|uniref:L-threonylcarbamoyladenylate synthase n=1 Tax=Porphyromonas catoniae ATCC 51270 TaxID=887901 RepID=Z4WX86_9PORP|nr:L-threonylcarbamoyladenylate synthase [Porphyromonas catoniae]EWC92099.1 tRNA threonylcarbamoyl adenosine modification protein, Sua5/YciO/YrdC/YwlC family [Porphyromonas catoniae ATCC 51270]
MKIKETIQPSYDKADLDEAVATLRQGGIILYPTDTVWGIGCDATNEEAVQRIYALKRRQDSKSMLVLVAETHEVERLISDVPEIAYDLMELAVRPITIVYTSGASGVAPSLIGEGGSLGIRQTQEAFSSALCRQLRRPIVSTSANISGEPTPLFFSGISEEIRSGVDYIVRYLQEDNTPREPSQIIQLGTGGEVKVLRP